MKEEITTDTTELQRTVRNYYEQLYVKKFDNLGKMKIYLETYNLPKLYQEEESLDRLLTASEIEAIIKKLMAHKRLDWMASQVNFTQHLGKR